MRYIAKNWVNRSKQYQNRFKMKTNTDGTVTLTEVPGINIPGTPVNAANMNNIENGVYQISQDIDGDATVLTLRNLNLNILDLAAELEMFKTSELTGVDSYLFLETFTNADDIELYDGILDVSNHKIKA